MKTCRIPVALWGRLVGVAALTLLLSGCATPRIDWAARAGNYTYDQAVVEIGPPDKREKLQDGTLVAEWLTRRGYRYAYPAFGYYGGYPGGYFSPPFVDSYSPDYFLRLTFGPDGKLQAWKKFTK